VTTALADLDGKLVHRDFNNRPLQFTKFDGHGASRDA
jgi:hypothetical protein